MVTQITEGTAFDKQGRPFRRRNFMPGILMFAALAVVTLIIWRARSTHIKAEAARRAAGT